MGLTVTSIGLGEEQLARSEFFARPGALGGMVGMVALGLAEGRSDRCNVSPGRVHGDITYLRTWEGWVYLATVIDAHSRRVVGWAIADHMRTDLIEDALRMALVLRGDRPATVIFHRDRGTQYASEQITLFAAQNGITRSMGYTGICWDNAMAESFFATLNTEFYYRRVWPTRARAIRGVSDWIEDRYNRRRRHSSIGHVTPVDFEMQYSSQAAEIQLAA